MAKLAKGYNVVINQKVGATTKPIYPFTKAANVIDAEGNGIDTVISGILAKNFVPDFTSETVSDLRFLRNDNTWATIQSASTTQAGVVQLSNSLASTSETTAATSKAAKDLKDAIDLLNNTVETEGSVLKSIKDTAVNATFSVDEEGNVTTIKKAIEDAQSGAEGQSKLTLTKAAQADAGYAATYVFKQGGNDLDTTGEGAVTKINIPKDFLVKSGELKTVTVDDQPYAGAKVGDKYIDFVINTKDASETEEHMYIPVNDLFDSYTTGSESTDAVVVVVDNSTNKISATVTDGTISRAKVTAAFESDIAKMETALQKDAEGTMKTVSARVKDEAASATYKAATEGAAEVTISGAIDDLYDKIETGIGSLDSTVTQEANDQGIAATVIEEEGKLTSVSVTQTAATATANGYMSKEYAAKLDNCAEVAVSATAPAFSTGDGIWFQIVSEDAE